MIKQVDGVLLLMEEEAGGVAAADIDVEDEMQRAEVLELEFDTQLGDDIMKKSSVRCDDDNIIDVQEEVGHMISVMKHEQQRV